MIGIVACAPKKQSDASRVVIKHALDLLDETGTLLSGS